MPQVKVPESLPSRNVGGLTQSPSIRCAGTLAPLEPTWGRTWKSQERRAQPQGWAVPAADLSSLSPMQAVSDLLLCSVTFCFHRLLEAEASQAPRC